MGIAIGFLMQTKGSTDSTGPGRLASDPMEKFGASTSAPPAEANQQPTFRMWLLPDRARD
jgi:hypothetical protein